MSIRCLPFQLDCQSCEQKHLHCSTRCIPEGSRDSITVRHPRALEQCGCPGPRRDNSTSNETCFDRSSSRAEHLHLRGLDLRVIPLENISDGHHPDGKSKAQAEYDAIAEACTERRGYWHDEGDTAGRSSICQGLKQTLQSLIGKLSR